MGEQRIFVKGDLSSDDKFSEEMQKIKSKGFIPSHRGGDTGVGKTLEDELGIEENSIQAADLGAVEVKANRKGSSSKVTLFTKSPDKRGVNSTLRKKYGYHTDESNALNADIPVLRIAVNGRDFNTLNGQPFMKLTPKDDRIYLEHAKDGILEDAYWGQERLKKAFERKYPAKKMYHVQAQAKKDNDTELFYYDEVYSLENFSADKMIDALKSGDIEIDIRLGMYASGKRKGKIHDNGSAIRVSSEKLESYFDKKKKLL